MFQRGRGHRVLTLAPHLLPPAAALLRPAAGEVPSADTRCLDPPARRSPGRAARRLRRAGAAPLHRRQRLPGPPLPPPPPSTPPAAPVPHPRRAPPPRAASRESRPRLRPSWPASSSIGSPPPAPPLPSAAPHPRCYPPPRRPPPSRLSAGEAHGGSNRAALAPAASLRAPQPRRSRPDQPEPSLIDSFPQDHDAARRRIDAFFLKSDRRLRASGASPPRMMMRELEQPTKKNPEGANDAGGYLHLVGALAARIFPEVNSELLCLHPITSCVGR